MSAAFSNVIQCDVSVFFYVSTQLSQVEDVETSVQHSARFAVPSRIPDHKVQTRSRSDVYLLHTMSESFLTAAMTFPCSEISGLLLPFQWQIRSGDKTVHILKGTALPPNAHACTHARTHAHACLQGVLPAPPWVYFLGHGI